MGTPAHLEPIPRPPGHLFVGNLFDLDPSHPVESLMDLARKHGPIYELEVPGGGSKFLSMPKQSANWSNFEEMAP
jgi:hypothetical protein